MTGFGKKLFLGALAVTTLTVFGPLAGQASAAGGCAEKRAHGLPCGGHPDKGLGRYREVQQGQFTMSVMKCDAINAKRMSDVEPGMRKNVALVRCPNLTMEQTRAKYGF